MAHSYTQITITDDGGVADKDNTEFSFDFDYINTGDIKAIVSLNPSAGTPTWTAVLTNSGATGDFDANGIDATNKKIKLAASPNSSSSAVAGSAIRIYRSTTLNPVVDFQAGSRISETDLDNAYRQGLFAAQEVSENASTLGGSGAALGTNSVGNSQIASDAVTAGEIQANAVGTSEIANTSVGADQLASSLDLSSKTVTLNNTTLNLSGAQFGGILPETKGGTGLTAKPPGTIIECVSGPCLGMAHSAISGADHTLPDAGTAGTALTATFANIPGSVFQYRAPLGVSKICYELNFSVAREGTLQAKHYAMFRLYLGDNGAAVGGAYTEVTQAKFAIAGEHHVTRVSFKWTFPVDDSEYSSYSAGAGNVAHWGADASTQGTRHIKLMGREIINGSDIRHSKVNGVYLWDDTATGSSDSLTENTAVFICPVITVTAIK